MLAAVHHCFDNVDAFDVYRFVLFYNTCVVWLQSN